MSSKAKNKSASKKVKKAQKKETQNQVQKRVGFIEELSSIGYKKDIPQFRAGDKVVVKSKIKEGDKERLQAYEGVVIARNGRGIQECFTVRKISSGVGVERVFPLHSPMIASIEVKSEGFVRRAKLYYLRKLDGRAARIKDKNLKLLESQGGFLAPEAQSTETIPETIPTSQS